MLVLLSAGPGGGRAGDPRGDRDRARPHGHRSSTTTCSTRLRLRRGRPTVVARSGREAALAVGDLLFSRAFAELGHDGEQGQVELLSERLGRPRARRAGAAPRRIRRVDLRGALPAALRAEDRAPVRVRLPDRADRAMRPKGRSALRTFGREIGLAFQLLDDVLDVTGPPERTGKARGTDLLDGTVTLPLILARERDPSLAELDLRALDAAGGGGVCDRIAATGVARRGSRRRAAPGRGGQAGARTRRARARAPAAPRAGRRGRRGALLLARAPLEVLGEDVVRVRARRRSDRSGPPCWRGSGR